MMNHKQAVSTADSTQPTRKSPSSRKPASRLDSPVKFIPDLITDEACCNEKAIAELNIPPGALAYRISYSSIHSHSGT